MRRLLRAATWAGVASVVLALVLWGARPAAGQIPLSVQLIGVDASSFPLVTATVSVADASGLPISDLPPASFRVTANGRPVPVMQVRTALDAGVGIAVVLAIDVSGSMQGDPLVKAKQVARDFVSRLTPADQAMVLVFSDSISVAQPFTANKDALYQAIDRLQARGNTALYDAVATAVEAATAAGLPRRAVVLLSDGADFGGLSRTSREGSLATASGRGVPFFTVGLGPQPDRDYLTQLASRSRGRAMWAPTPADLPPVFEEVHALLRSQYLVQFDLGANARAGTYDLQVEVTRGADRGQGGRSVEVAPPGYRPPQVSLPALTQGARLSEPVLLLPAISASRRIISARYLLDDQEVARTDSPPFQYLLDPVTITPGPHHLRLEVADELGGMGTAEVALVVAQVPPRVRLASPSGEMAPGPESLTTLRGKVRLEAQVTSQEPVQWVRFLLDGQVLAEAAAPPFAVVLEPGKVPHGPIHLTVVARDIAGQEGQALFQLVLTGEGAGPKFLPMAAGAAAALAVAAGAVVVGRWRRATRAAFIPSPPEAAPSNAVPEVTVDPSFQASQQVPVETALARLTVHRRQDGALVQEASLGRAPFTVGSSSGCDLVLPGEGIAPHHLRLWYREGHFMLHDLTRRGEVTVNGHTVLWAVLEDGDTIELGPYVLRFRLPSPPDHVSA